jgi:hypothetical protein
MSWGQIIFLGLGAVMILSSLDLSSLTKLVEKKTTPPAPKQVASNDDLILVVTKWSEFKDICVKNNLTEAVTKLDEIFPMLIKVDQ